MSTTQTDTATLAGRFVESLGALEQDRQLDDLVALFADDARLQTTALSKEFSGPDGARDFWHAYRKTFGDMASTYDTIMSDEDTVVLEWKTTGDTSQGHPVDYRGVSVLKVSGGRIGSFRAYFDPAALTQQL